MMKKNCVLLFCSAVSHLAHAQTPSMWMPEGSTDIDLGIAALIAPDYEGSNKQKFYLAPFVSVAWSNGVFLTPGEIGFHLPSPSHIQYGPLLNYEWQPRSPDRHPSPLLTLTPGAYLNYRIDHNLGFRSRLDYSTSAQHSGIRLNLASWFRMSLAPHYSVSTEAGLSLANHRYMQSYFGVSSEQAISDHLTVYTAKAGIKNTYLQIGWNAELSPKYELFARININRLGGNAANSPFTTKATTVSLLTALMYHY